MSLLLRLARFSPPFWATLVFFVASMAAVAISREALINASEGKRSADLSLVQTRPWYVERVARIDVVTQVIGPDAIMNQKQTLRVTYEDGTTFSTDNMPMISVMILHMPREKIHREFRGNAL
jgi:hypothetical protein